MLPFEGVGRPFRSEFSVSDVEVVANDIEALAVFAQPQRDAENLAWFTGRAVLIDKRPRQLQILATEEACSTCVCVDGFGHYKLVLTDSDRGLRAEARVDRTGGDSLRLEPRDASSLEFTASTLASDDEASALIARFFPALQRKIHDDPTVDAVVNTGKLVAKQLLFTKKQACFGARRGARSRRWWRGTWLACVRPRESARCCGRCGAKGCP